MSRTVTLTRAVLRVLAVVWPRAGGRIAFEFFCHPVGRSAVRPHEVEAHGAAMVETMRVDGKDVRVYRWGGGDRPVLFMHGWESRGSRFAPLVQPLLDAGFTPISFDAPGHGESMSRGSTIPFNRSVAAAIESRFGPLAAIVGHSFGVPSAFYAAKYGVSVRCLVGVAGPSRFAFLDEEFARRLQLPAALRVDVRRRLERALLPLTNVFALLSVHDSAARLTAPILLVHDADDPTVPLAEAELTAAAYGDQVELVVTSGLGHSRVLADPDVVRRIVAFISTHGADT